MTNTGKNTENTLLYLNVAYATVSLTQDRIPMSTNSSAASFQKTRRDHSQETAEDYVEAVADLIDKTGTCRVTELARRLGVSHVTTSRAISRLQNEGFVDTEPYRPITLTASGQRLARQARNRHATVLECLRAMGVPSADAARDAEGIEHHCSPATLRAMKKLTSTLEDTS